MGETKELKIKKGGYNAFNLAGCRVYIMHTLSLYRVYMESIQRVQVLVITNIGVMYNLYIGLYSLYNISYFVIVVNVSNKQYRTLLLICRCKNI